MSLFLSKPNDPETRVALTIPELQPHVEFVYKQKLPFLALEHRFRTESRYFHFTNLAKRELEHGYYFGNIRFRYQLMATIPIWKIDEHRAMRIKLSEEIHLNTRNKNVHNRFDQNRVYA